MKEKLHSSIKTLNELLPEHLRYLKSKERYYHFFKIPITNLTRDKIYLNREEATIEIKDEHFNVIEESDRYIPLGGYATYGFCHTYSLPENVEVKNVQLRSDEFGVDIMWAV